MGIGRLVRKCLGKRPAQSKYTSVDILLSHWLYIFAGAERLEDTSFHGEELETVKGVKVASPDAYGRVFKGWATEHTYVETDTSRHTLNFNEPLNALMIDVGIKTKLVRKRSYNILDYDTTIIEHRKSDSSKTYKQVEGQLARGYQVGAAFLNGIPCYFEGRGGNTSASFDIDKTVWRCLSNLKDRGVKVSVFRCDAAGHKHDLFEMLDREDIKFYVRGRSAKWVNDMMEDYTAWKTYYIKKDGERQKVELCSVIKNPTGPKYRHLEYRYVIQRVESDNGIMSVNGRKYKFKTIVTNDRASSEIFVHQTYNQRGSEERRFDELKNQFNWRRIPFSYLNQNTVFMMINAIGLILYRYVLKYLNKHLSYLPGNLWLKRFRFLFICVVATLADDGYIEFSGISKKRFRELERLQI